MNKIEIEVPIDIRYISDWVDFNTDLLKGHCILNKTITGCGFTHYCLTNNIPTILCSPRKFLLENKHEQLENTYLVINTKEALVNVDEDIISTTKIDVQSNLTTDFETVQNIQFNLNKYLLGCLVNDDTPKILVTYDSLKYVLEVIGQDIINYSIIVDEFQNIFMDSRFKANTELNFISYLQDCPNVTYLSATPYIDEYLDELDEFKDLPYYELKWDSSRLRKIGISLRKTSHPSRELDKIIGNYKDGMYISKYIDGVFYESKEVVFYVNSVRMIKNTIKRNKLTSDQVNIICADTPKNRKDLESIGHLIGKAPGIGKEHKMFTFCTRTTYVGADFYSTNAYSVIVSDCAIDSLATDIRMDFPQIMGRQRLKENVFRDDCLFIYKLSDNDVTVDKFEEISLKKILISQGDINNYNAIVSQDNTNCDSFRNDIRRRVLSLRYQDDYTAVQEKTGNIVINKLVYLAEKRAFELRSNSYKNEVTVYNEFSDIAGIEVSNELGVELENSLSDLRYSLTHPGSFETKMRLLCEFLEKYSGYVTVYDIKGLNINFRNYVLSLGTEKIRAKGYHESELKKELELLKSGDKIRDQFLTTFSLGQTYSLKEAKEMIRNIYLGLGLSKTPKATDLEEFFNLIYVGIYEKHTKKRVKGYRILSIK